MKKLTYEELHRQLMYNPWNGLFYLKVKRERTNIGDIVGTKRKDGYVIITINHKLYLAHRLAWFYVKGYMPENDIDHLDRITHHNWFSNLEHRSHQCNVRNTGNFSHNTSGVKGVSWNKSRNKWKAEINLNGKTQYIGQHEEFEEAVCLRLAMEQCLNWHNCDSHSPAYQYVQKLLTRR